jgi:hypothetical protein
MYYAELNLTDCAEKQTAKRGMGMSKCIHCGKADLIVMGSYFENNTTPKSANE